jgi:signal peptidase I
MQSTMSAITAVVLAAFAAYAAAFFFGVIEGNFALLLMLATALTGVYWLAEKLFFLPRRRRDAQRLQDTQNERSSALAQQGFVQAGADDVEHARQKLLMQPWWLDWTAGLFPVILVVFLLRSFLFEPFKIPSGSMIPTLLVGDLILVNKFHYGVRLPVINKKIIDNNPVERGDVMVFRYPVDPRMDYIKRVVGLPGDEITYVNQKLSVNGQSVPVAAQGEFYDEDSLRYTPQFSEKLGNVEHRILVEPRRQAYYGPDPKTFPMAQNCRYSPEGVSCKVPQGHYFLMGDNRDNSQDSRFWGFVPDENIVGKAFFVWMNFGDLGRVGPFH